MMKNLKLQPSVLPLCSLLVRNVRGCTYNT